MDLKIVSPDNPDEVRPKKGKKKKLKPKLSKKLQVKQQEEARIRLALARQKYLEEAKERVTLELETNRGKKEVFREQHEKKIRDLKRSFQKLSEIEEDWWKFKHEIILEEEWKRYLNCNKLPDPLNHPEMSTYKYVWTEEENDSSMPYTLRKTEEVMELLLGLEEAISDPWPNYSENVINNWKALRNEMRNLLQDQVDKVTYRLFRRIETEMEPIDMTTTKYYCETNHFAMRLWAELITPIPSGRATEVRHPMKVSFEPVNVTVIVPAILLDVHKVMRVLVTKYDHWSDRARTFNLPPVPSYHKKDLLQLAERELEIRTEIVRQREHFERLLVKRISAIPPQATISQELNVWDCKPQRVLSDEVAYREAEDDEGWKNGARMKLDNFEVNLRERQFLGGLLIIGIYHQPPQPKYLRYKHDVTLLTEPPVLHPIQYLVTYPPPALELLPDEEPTEDNIQRLRLENQALMEKQKNELINIQFKLPETAYWFETPEIAHWNDKEGYWSSDHIYDRRFDEEEEMMVCNVGILGIFGLHVSRFCNLPYRDWRLEGDGTGGVNFYLEAANVTFQFKIQENKVCLEKAENLPANPFPGMLNTFYTPLKLVQMLKGFGIDIFPEPDAVCYVPELSPKHIVCEKYIYQIWGIFSESFIFKFSKFNRDGGRRNFIFQIKEVYDSYQSDFCLMKTSPIDACILDVNEESESYSPRPAPGIQVTTDIYNLILKNCTSRARRRADAASFVLVQTIHDLLSYIRPLSFS